MPQEQEEREINLHQLMVVTLRKWRLLFVASICGLLLGVVYDALRPMTPVLSRDADASVQETTTQSTSYEAAWEDYETTWRYYTAVIERDKKRLQDSIAYAENSLLMQTDPFHTYSVAFTLFVIPEQETAEVKDASISISMPTDIVPRRLQNAYVSMLKNADLPNACAALNRQPEELRELISVSADGNGAGIYGSVFGPDEETVVLLAQDLLSCATAYRDQAAKDLGTHTLQILETEPAVLANTSILSTQNQRVQAVEDIRKQLEEHEKSLDALKEPVRTTQGLVIRHPHIRKGMLGLFAGLFLAALAIICYEIFSNRFLSAQEFAERCRIPLLGVISGGAKEHLNPIDARLRVAGVDASWLKLSRQEQEEMLSANCAMHLAGTQQLILAGTVSAQLLEEVRTLLARCAPSADIACGGNLIDDAATVREIKGYENVILVEACEKSRYPDVDHEMQLLSGWQKNVLGGIMLYL